VGFRTAQARPATPFEVIASPTERPRTATVPPPNDRGSQAGWLATTGEVLQLTVANERIAATPDLIGINSEGTLYAIDASTGVARWIARRDNKRNPTTAVAWPPVFVSDNPRLVIVGDGQIVRALDMTTGREIWINERYNNIAGVTVVDLDTRPGAEIYLATAKPDRVFVLDSNSGTVRGAIELTKSPQGPPVVLQRQAGAALLVPLKEEIEIVSAAGRSQVLKAGAELTTPPLVVSTRRGRLILAGTRLGLAAFDANTLEPMGRVVLERGDYPVDGLVSAPLLGGIAETLFMTTNSGRVVSVNLADGKVNWSSENLARLAPPLLADINGDGEMELVVPGARGFATALSARDGTIVWQSTSEQPLANTNISARPLGLAFVTLSDGRSFIVGNDSSGVGLRGMRLKGGAARNVAY
jgi:outer membrane protein assembly factor BamB